MGIKSSQVGIYSFKFIFPSIILKVQNSFPLLMDINLYVRVPDFIIFKQYPEVIQILHDFVKVEVHVKFWIAFIIQSHQLVISPFRPAIRRIDTSTAEGISTIQISFITSW